VELEQTLENPLIELHNLVAGMLRGLLPFMTVESDERLKVLLAEWIRLLIPDLSVRRLRRLEREFGLNGKRRRKRLTEDERLSEEVRMQSGFLLSANRNLLDRHQTKRTSRLKASLMLQLFGKGYENATDVEKFCIALFDGLSEKQLKRLEAFANRLMQEKTSRDVALANVCIEHGLSEAFNVLEQFSIVFAKRTAQNTSDEGIL
jgi:hypothetical protein